MLTYDQYYNLYMNHTLEDLKMYYYHMLKISKGKLTDCYSDNKINALNNAIKAKKGKV